MGLRLTTFGGLRIDGVDGELDGVAAQRARVAFMVYVAVERRTTRESAAALFWPDSSPDSARHALRQSLYHLRKLVGPEWVEARAHELRAAGALHTDTDEFSAAVQRGDVAAATRLYTGHFLDGTRLVDHKGWESWVDGRRAQYAREFRRACREWVQQRLAAGDVESAIDAARRWAAPDPYDDEAQHALIEVLAAAGERTEAILQFDAYSRLLSADGLSPLEHTQALIERVRTRLPEQVPVTGVAVAAEAEPPAAAEATAEAEPGVGSGAAPARAGEARERPALAHHGEARERLRRRTSWTGRSYIAAAVCGALLLGGTYGFVARYDVQIPVLRSIDDTAIDRIVLADFAGPAADPGLGAVITDALRMDLHGTGIVRVVDAAEVAEVLRRMNAGGLDTLSAAVAREVALRSGAKAVLEGTVAQAGTGFVLTASLRAASTDRVLAGFRESAATADDLIGAIDRLSRQVRRQAGESLRSAAGGPELPQVTTASLDALRSYSTADRAFQRRDYTRAIELLEQALEFDPEFGMAWRFLAVVLANAGADREREVYAATRAHDLRERSSPREQHLAAAGYHHRVTRDAASAAAAYARVLDLDPYDVSALNNLALLRRRAGDLDGATALLERAIAQSRPTAVAHLNLVHTLLAQDNVERAAAEAASLARRYPDGLPAIDAQYRVLLRQGRAAAAAELVTPLLARLDGGPGQRAWAQERLAFTALWEGRLEDARTKHAAAQRAAEADAPHEAPARRLRAAHAEVAVGDPARGVRALGRACGTGDAAGSCAAQAVILALAGSTSLAAARLEAHDADASVGNAAPDERAVVARALLLVAGGDPNAAVRLIEDARSASECRHCFAAVMGRAHVEGGRLQAAAAEWEAVLAGRDNADDLGIQLAEQLWVLTRLPGIYEAIGERDRALPLYRRLAAMWNGADPELRRHASHAHDRIAALESVTRRAPAGRLSAGR